jgi:hypothetical protein
MGPIPSYCNPAHRQAGFRAGLGTRREIHATADSALVAEVERRLPFYPLSTKVETALRMFLDYDDADLLHEIEHEIEHASSSEEIRHDRV